ncbi:MAG: UDP-4-amino-4,6-dideoxy-N-acetyl-beta-L-altrosamine transaminase [Candidatus Omnitrophica bacterium CG11_big_fil_rev_8_21_14_0_20_63_9]|nr:MAG: UDP-4-amino-4,6-dideoxy-N-acetyl-beta-L-altrosamine transaminase [Candidatus Omnitrophica bacterium CG11_big_fil_rev_8_21_14_0_20_63_9]
MPDVVSGEPLAIQGGPPVRERWLPYAQPSLDQEAIRAAVEILESHWLTTGPQVEAFETAMAQAVGAREAVAVSSGTAALHAAVFAARIGPGDEVITTPLTFVATANCIVYQGGIPVFADIEPHTLCIDPLQIERRITRRTRALLIMHYGGHPCDLQRIHELARHHRLTVIEDASHALGAADRKRRIGGLSDLTTFSFQALKQLTTGEGGMVTTQDTELANRMRMFRHHGMAPAPGQRPLEGSAGLEMSALGYNYRLTDFQCALGLRQLHHLESRLARRREIAAQYTAAFRSMPEIELPDVKPHVEHAWHLYPILLRLDRTSADRNQVLAALRAENIGVTVHYFPVHLHPYYRERYGCAPGDYPVAESVAARLITLPLFPGMTGDDVADVIQAVTKVLAAYRGR